MADPAPPFPPIMMPPFTAASTLMEGIGSDIQQGNQLQIGNYFGNSASKKRGDSNVYCTNESFWTLFMNIKHHRAEKSRSATKKCCKNAKDCSTYWICGLQQAFRCNQISSGLWPNLWPCIGLAWFWPNGKTRRMDAGLIDQATADAKPIHIQRPVNSLDVDIITSLL